MVTICVLSDQWVGPILNEYLNYMLVCSNYSSWTRPRMVKNLSHSREILAEERTVTVLLMLPGSMLDDRVMDSRQRE